MKKIYLLSLLLSVSCWLSAQTFISEDFSSGTMPPSGWTIDAHAANWLSGTSANAGGTAPEAVFYYDPAFTAASRLISPVIDLTGYTSVKLMFKHFLDDYAGASYSIGVATRSNNGTWNTVWTVNPTGNIGPEEKVIDISNADVGSSTFQFCIFFNGYSYNLDYWYIDDISLFYPYDVDGSMTQITTQKYVSGSVPVEGVLRNLGNSTITSVEISWKVSDDMVYSTTFDGLSLGFSDSYSFSCDDPFFFPIGSYALDVWISTVNGAPDGNEVNNLLSKDISVVSNTVDRLPAFEEFTSSTCAPCAQFNTSFNPWCESHADQITLVKYQMDWPGNGDPYYTEEGGTRRMYYGVSYVPWPQCNGAYVDYSISAVQAAFDEAIQKPGIAKIVASHTLDGTVITVNANILPFADFADFRAHIIVIENTTTGNVGSNGETEFHHVMMKMIPDANGTIVNALDRESVSITETVDLAGTNIEEYDDLSVVVLFQDYATKEIYQSAYSVEDGAYSVEAQGSSMTYNGIPVPDFTPQVLEYNIELPEGTTEVPIVEGIAADPKATVVVLPTWELPGTTIVDMFSEDLVHRVTYQIHFSVEVGIHEKYDIPQVIIFPNPVKDVLRVENALRTDIRIFTITGQLVKAFNNYDGSVIDMSSLENGIYLVRVKTDENSYVNQKITVLR
jgi:hypothetical protein